MELILDIEKNNKSIKDYVYDVLKYNIVNWHLKPGQQLSEKKVSEVLDVSRTPVRESFIKLKSQRLLDIVPQKGSFVSKIDLDYISEGVFIRNTLEMEIIKLSINILTKEDIKQLEHYIELQKFTYKEKKYNNFVKYDDKFHEKLFTSCKKYRSLQVTKDAMDQFKRLRILSMLDYGNYEMLIEEHISILEAIKNKDINGAEKKK